MKKDLVNQLENGIIEFIEKFHSAPYSSYSENDLLCGLFNPFSLKMKNAIAPLCHDKPHYCYNYIV